ncbi:hypothetical protein [Thermoflavimicrobium daqui]|uniref:Uncharacterized protein n=1 Tax=Thermoflavimicrobium daqui TaxID=2137476 RepID=A0A364K0R5_9BACL|nr:hypothetical protein [Thermoflavimicrobium daqui]RAL21097.1 hypothetical protein DL897_17175 [Thermoflavimicrobium daqui]
MSLTTNRVFMWKETLLRASTVTALAINLMLAGLLLARDQVIFEKAVPSFAGTIQPHLKQEFRWELYKASVEDLYIVEHYKEYEYHYDKSGRFVSKRPTGQDSYLRYWRKSPLS